jgi:hypothetical protein
MADSVEWKFRTDISGQITGLIFKDQQAMHWNKRQVLR